MIDKNKTLLDFLLNMMLVPLDHKELVPGFDNMLVRTPHLKNNPIRLFGKWEEVLLIWNLFYLVHSNFHFLNILFSSQLKKCNLFCTKLCTLWTVGIHYFLCFFYQFFKTNINSSWRKSFKLLAFTSCYILIGHVLA